MTIRQLPFVLSFLLLLLLSGCEAVAGIFEAGMVVGVIIVVIIVAVVGFVVAKMKR